MLLFKKKEKNRKRWPPVSAGLSLCDTRASHLRCNAPHPALDIQTQTSCPSSLYRPDKKKRNF